MGYKVILSCTTRKEIYFRVRVDIRLNREEIVFIPVICVHRLNRWTVKSRYIRYRNIICKTAKNIKIIIIFIFYFCVCVCLFLSYMDMQIFIEMNSLRSFSKMNWTKCYKTKQLVYTHMTYL